MTNIIYGNREGQYFTEWRFDELRYLLNILTGQTPLGQLQIPEAKIYYDSQQDFHHLEFSCNGHNVNVRLYKVFSANIDGTDAWVGCPRRAVHDFAISIRRKLDPKVDEFHRQHQ